MESKKREQVWMLVISIILFCIAAVFLVLAIYNISNSTTRGPNDYHFGRGIVFTLFTVVLMTVSWGLNLIFRGKNKGNAGVVSLVFFILSIGGAVGVVVLWCIWTFFKEVTSTPSSSGIEIEDGKGNTHILTHVYGRSYKDEDGNRWTQDYFDKSKFTKD